MSLLSLRQVCLFSAGATALAWCWHRSRRFEAHNTSSYQLTVEPSQRFPLSRSKASISLVDMLDCCQDVLVPFLFMYLTPSDSAKLQRGCLKLCLFFSFRAVLPKLAALTTTSESSLCNEGITDLLDNRTEIQHEDVIRAIFFDALLSNGNLDLALASKNSTGKTPLVVAVQRNVVAAVEALCWLGAPPDQGDSNSGWSPLMFALSSGNQRLAKILVHHGASVSFVARPHGYTPLLSALANRYESLVEWLLDCKADPTYEMRILKSNLLHMDVEPYKLLIRVLDKRRL